MSRGKRFSTWKARPLGRPLVFGRAIVRQEEMKGVLRHLEDQLSNYYVVVKRPRIDWAQGQLQQQFVKLDGPAQLLTPAGEINAILPSAKEVRLHGQANDGGVLVLDQGLRRLEIVNPTPQIEELAQQLDTRLKGGEMRWLMLFEWGAVSPALWFVPAIITYFLVQAASPEGREALASSCVRGDSSCVYVPPVPPPEWVLWMLSISLVVSLVAFVLSLPSLFLLRRASGALLIWPEKLTVKQMLRLIAGWRRDYSFISTIRRILYYVVPLFVAAIIGGYAARLTG